MRRSAADGRDSYYVLDLARCGELLSGAGASLHPALAPTAPPRRRRRRAGLVRVLFLCTGNSARSQIAEALLEQLAGGAVGAASAGSNPKPLHPNAVRGDAPRGIDIAAHRSKHLDEFAGHRFDAVITLCDRVREVCPEFPGASELVALEHRRSRARVRRRALSAFERTAERARNTHRLPAAAIEPIAPTRR